MLGNIIIQCYGKLYLICLSSLNERLDNSSSVSAWIAKTAKQLLCQTIHGNGLALESILLHFILFYFAHKFYVHRAQTRGHGF